MAAVAWVNGRLVGPDEPAVPVTDPGFLYGEGLFETMRAYGGRVFRLAQHLGRLEAGAAALSLPVPPREALETAVQEAVAAGLPDASVRLTVTPGVSSPTPGTSSATTVVLVRPVTLPPAQQYRSGCHAVSVPIALAAGSPLRSVKSLNYLDKLLAQRQARHAGADEALLVDADGYIVEGATRNVFAVVGGALLTPPVSRGLLSGITRAAVLELAAARGLQAERDFTLSGLLSADEAFFTSSLAELLPIASVDGAPLPAAPGPVTQELTAAYRKLVADELSLPESPR